MAVEDTPSADSSLLRRRRLRFLCASAAKNIIAAPLHPKRATRESIDVLILGEFGWGVEVSARVQRTRWTCDVPVPAVIKIIFELII